VFFFLPAIIFQFVKVSGDGTIQQHKSPFGLREKRIHRKEARIVGAQIVSYFSR